MISGNLEKLASKYGSDKRAASHGYCEIYEAILGDKRKEVLTVVEIGTWEGRSLRMWADWFENAHLYGFDLPTPMLPCETFHGVDFANPRVALLKGDQANRDDLKRLVDATGSPIDIFIDDGGHTMEQQQVTLGYIFPYLADGGIYVCEDLYTCYHKSANGTDWNPTKTPWTTLGIFEAILTGNPWDSDFMLPAEKQYLMGNLYDIIIHKARLSEIAFITKAVL